MLPFLGRIFGRRFGADDQLQAMSQQFSQQMARLERQLTDVTHDNEKLRRQLGSKSVQHAQSAPGSVSAAAPAIISTTDVELALIKRLQDKEQELADLRRQQATSMAAGASSSGTSAFSGPRAADVASMVQPPASPAMSPLSKPPRAPLPTSTLTSALQADIAARGRPELRTTLEERGGKLRRGDSSGRESSTDRRNKVGYWPYERMELLELEFVLPSH